MILLDTDTLTLLLLNHAKVRSRFERVDANEAIAISVVTRIEMLRGRFDSILKAADKAELLWAMTRLRQLDEALDAFEVIGLDEPAADQFEKLRQNKKLKKIGRADLLIASVVLATNALLRACCRINASGSGNR